VPTFEDSEVSRGQRGGSPTVVNLSNNTKIKTVLQTETLPQSSHEGKYCFHNLPLQTKRILFQCGKLSLDTFSRLGEEIDFGMVCGTLQLIFPAYVEMKITKE
jgi:hypothetical protein